MKGLPLISLIYAILTIALDGISCSEVEDEPVEQAELQVVTPPKFLADVTEYPDEYALQAFTFTTTTVEEPSTTNPCIASTTPTPKDCEITTPRPKCRDRSTSLLLEYEGNIEKDDDDRQSKRDIKSFFDDLLRKIKGTTSATTETVWEDLFDERKGSKRDARVSTSLQVEHAIKHKKDNVEQTSFREILLVKAMLCCLAGKRIKGKIHAKAEEAMNGRISLSSTASFKSIQNENNQCSEPEEERASDDSPNISHSQISAK